MDQLMISGHPRAIHGCIQKVNASGLGKAEVPTEPKGFFCYVATQATGKPLAKLADLIRTSGCEVIAQISTQIMMDPTTAKAH